LVAEGGFAGGVVKGLTSPSSRTIPELRAYQILSDRMSV